MLLRRRGGRYKEGFDFVGNVNGRLLNRKGKGERIVILASKAKPWKRRSKGLKPRATNFV